MKLVRGFTLLELLIGLVLLSVLMALLFSGFRLASMSWDSVELRMELTMREQMARELIRRMLTQTQPLRLKKSPNRAIAFLGEPERLLAVVPVGEALGSGLQTVELSIGATETNGGESAQLLFRHIPVDQNADLFAADIAQAKAHVVLDALSMVHFEYFGAVSKGNPPIWHDSWSNTEELPRLIRIRLATADAGWSDLVVAPLLNGAGCRWDNFHKRCM